MDKVGEYRAFFDKEGVPFTPVAFIGDYQGRRYPHAYNEEEKKLVGLDQENRYWLHQIEPHVTRVRNFKAIPCIAGQRSLYITKSGELLRCLYDRERVLDRPLSEPEPCGVSSCGCGMLLEKINSVDMPDFYNHWASKCDRPQTDVSWMAPLAESLGYRSPADAIACEMRAMYDELMRAYGKDDFPE
jgi:hypothetical protein